MGRSKQDSLLSPLCLWGIVVAYVTINALTQGLVSSSAELDQARELLFSQDWQLGYSSQPPLYTWLVRIVFAVTGPCVSALLAIKAVLLSTLVALLLKVGKHFVFSKQQHLIVIVSMAFIFGFLWESQKDITHSALATVMSAATLLAILKTLRSPTTSKYIILGLVIGLGLISKYNYALFLLAVITTVILTRHYLQMILDYRLLISIAIAAAIAVPHGIWAINNTDILFGTVFKLDLGEGNCLWRIGRVLFNAMVFLTPLWIFALLLFSDRHHIKDTNQSNDRTFIVRLFVVMIAIVILFVLAIRAGEFSVRWFQPLLFFVPLLIALFSRASQNGLRVYCSIGASFAIAVAIALPLKNVLAEHLGFNERRNIPYPALARSLATTCEPAIIFAETDLLGGNIRSVFRRSRIIAPGYEGRGVSDSGVRLVICESADGQNDKFRTWISKRYGIDLSSLKFNRLEEPYYYMPMRKHILYWAKVDVSPPSP